MKLPRRRFLHLAAGAAALPAMSRLAWAQAYPSRPVTLIVFVPAGGTPDIIARLVGHALSQRLGQSVVIDNRPGGGGNLALQAVARAPAVADLGSEPLSGSVADFTKLVAQETEKWVQVVKFAGLKAE